MITNLLKDVTTEELKAELEKRKAQPQSTLELVQAKFPSPAVGSEALKQIIADLFDVARFYLDKHEEDFTEQFLYGMPLTHCAETMGILLGIPKEELTGEDIYPMN